MYRVLIVDDTPAEVECILFLIRKYGLDFSAKTASNGREALVMLQEEKFDILLTDIKMPLMDGLKLSRGARALDERMTIILFSGYSDFEYAKTAIAIGVTDYLMKPIVPDEFARTMQRVIGTIESGKRRERESVDVRRHMVYLLLNRAGGESEGTRLPIDYAYMMMLEFDRDFFGAHDHDFEAQIGDLLTVPFDFIALYPVRALVLFRNSAGADLRMLQRVERQVVELTKQRYNELCRVGVEKIDGVEDFYESYQRLETRMEPDPVRFAPSGSETSIFEVGGGKTGNRNVEVIKQYIYQHYEDSLTLNELAHMFYISPNHLCRIFKRETGDNLIKFINDYRMKKAREMLRGTTMKINAIAQAVGYKSASYFCQRFRDCYGMSPEQFRQGVPVERTLP